MIRCANYFTVDLTAPFRERFEYIVKDFDEPGEYIYDRAVV